MSSDGKWLHYVSKGVIVVPILIVVLALVFLYPGKNLNKRIFKPTPTPTPVITVENIDLDQEYVCKTDTWEAYIKKQKIYIKNIAKDSKNYLYKDDCLYSWRNNEYNGEKVCSLSPYISLLENLSRLKLLNLDTVIASFLPNEDKNKASKNIANLLQFCAKKQVDNTQLFEIPKNVLFKIEKQELQF